jgi:hypothetical protein
MNATRYLRAASLGAGVTLAFTACGGLLADEPDAVSGMDAQAPMNGGMDAQAPMNADGAADHAVSTSQPDASHAGDASPCLNVDLQTDTHNCGVCNRDCLGAVCATGVCTPIKLLEDAQHFVNAIAVDDNNLYFALDDTTPLGGLVASCPLTGCAGAPPTVLASADDSPGRIALDDTSVYWVDNSLSGNINRPTITGTINRCSKTGCANTPERLLTNEEGIRSLALASDSLFWSEDHGANPPSVLRCTVSGGCAATQQLLLASFSYTGVAANADWVVWGSDSTTILGCQHTKSAADGGCGASPHVIVTTAEQPDSLAVDATQVYWTEADYGAKTTLVKTCSIQNCVAPTTLWSTAPVGIFVDATNVYSVRSSAGGISKCAKTGCGGSPTILVAGQALTGIMTVDSTWLYYGVNAANGIGSGIYRTPK